MRTVLILAGLVLIAILVRMSFFTVDPTEYVYVTQLGRHLATFDGAAADTDAGLHWRWPWPIQSLQRLDRRLQHFDLPATELLTQDAESRAQDVTIDKTLTVETYACWRIASSDAVDLFLRRIGTPERARAILGQHINSQLGAAIGRMHMEDLVSQEPGRVESKMEELRRQLIDKLRPQVQDYGMELMDVRLRRFNHPAQVREAIFERIKSERNKKVEYYRSEGAKQAQNIRSAADAKVRELLALARFEEETLKGQADTEAVLLRNQAHSKDPDFYVFLKKMEKLQSILGDNKTVLLLSSHRAIFDTLFQPPQPSAGNGSPPGPRTVHEPGSVRQGRKNGGE